MTGSSDLVRRRVTGRAALAVVEEVLATEGLPYDQRVALADEALAVARGSQSRDLAIVYLTARLDVERRTATRYLDTVVEALTTQE